MPRTALIPAFCALCVLAAACGYTEGDPETQDIVAGIPWPEQERTQYLILDSDGDEVLLTGTLSAELQDSQYEMHLQFEDMEGQTDESLVLVDAETMKPDSVRREIQRTDETVIIEGEYDEAEGILDITEIDEEGDERTLPLRLEDHYYDNESSLFLWRTIPFEEGYEANYHTVIAAQGVQHNVNIQVDSMEEITIEAGTFDAWLVEIRSQDRTQRAWFSDTPERLLLQYDNSRGQLFQLEELP